MDSRVLGKCNTAGFVACRLILQKGNALLSLRTLGDPARPCACTPKQIARYRSRISGPLLDRIDIHIGVPRVEWKELSGDETGESSADIRERIEISRACQQSPPPPKTYRRQTHLISSRGLSFSFSKN